MCIRDRSWAVHQVTHTHTHTHTIYSVIFYYTHSSSLSLTMFLLSEKNNNRAFLEQEIWMKKQISIIDS